MVSSRRITVGGLEGNAAACIVCSASLKVASGSGVGEGVLILPVSIKESSLI